MRKEKEKTINNINFKVTQLGFEDGIKLLTNLGHLIGPSLVSYASVDFSSTELLGDIIGRLSALELKNTIDKLAKNTRIEREPGKWPVLEPEVDLAGNYNLTFKWLGFALEANFEDFFLEGGLLRGLIESPKESIAA